MVRLADEASRGGNVAAIVCQLGATLTLSVLSPPMNSSVIDVPHWVLYATAAPMTTRGS